MTALERLLAEGLPTGTFGGARPAPVRHVEVRPWMPDEQARHYAELAEAIGVSPLRVIVGEAA